ncbi:MAG: molecular chaperone DnaJ [Spirochaetia bacterium]
MAKRDYYDVLGVGKGASKDEIKKAYRRLAVQFHPDRNPGDKQAEDKFKAATEAYEVLADQKKRQAYDQFGFSGLDGMGFGAHDFSSVFHDFEDIFDGFNFTGFFDSFFGGGGRSRSRTGSGRSSARRGADLRYDLEISFADAVFGEKREITFTRSESCGECKGTGADKGSGKKICPSCGGTGQVRRSSGFFSIATTCPSCSGEGEIIEKPCSACGGNGLISRRRSIKITSPPGIESGKRINIPGQGDGGLNGGPPGDLYVYIRVLDHEYFERDGNDLYCVIPLSVSQVALGAEIFVSTLENSRTVKLKIPPGTQNGKMLRLKNEGVPYLHSPDRRGDMYIKIIVEIPTKISGKARSLLKELGSVTGEQSSPKPVRLSDLR